MTTRIFRNKKGSVFGLVLIALLVLFLFGMIFAIMYRVWNPLYDKVEPELDSNWLPALVGWKKAITYSPIIGFILVIIILIIKAANENNGQVIQQ